MIAVSSSRKFMLAIEAVAYIAYNSGADPVSSKEISENLGIQQRYLEHLMQRFVHIGILRGIRGPRGGYVLAREKRKITLADICDAMEEECESGNEETFGSSLGRQVIFPRMLEVQSQINDHLRQITLEEICKLALEKAIPGRLKQHEDFII
jgi:Rrf2 family protein